MADDASGVVALIRDESHAAAIVLEMRRRAFERAKKAFAVDCPRSTVNLLSASFDYIEALEADRARR